MTLIFRISIVLISWFSIIFLPKSSFRKYLTVTLFSACVLLAETMMAIGFKWWKTKGGVKYTVYNAFSFIFGPFFAINMWIFHFTNGRFLLYTFINLIMDLIFAFGLNIFFQNVGAYKLKKFKSKHLFYTAFAYSFINYGFQKLVEKGDVNS
ncbi:hypothetical protein [Cytobacillus gottheilii]|uniref:Uncharacterized protein n=1 Tax=Cytobacillus gottheilii TaxID=859144 RepID=A0ABX8FHM2_9BACI|nr:hypothetical protein [Cytobacillus gottheilii]QVY63505.1 hypothetical protein J1899_10850 [Cytobacillus gottheilii]